MGWFLGGVGERVLALVRGESGGVGGKILFVVVVGVCEGRERSADEVGAR